MVHSLRLCRCARGIARSCFRCCCFRSRFRPSWVWSPEPLPCLRERTPRTSTSCCFSPTMWCLLQLVWGYSEQFCRRNETSFSYPCCADRRLSGLRDISGVICRARGCHAGQRLPDHLLSRAFGMDGVFALFHKLHRLCAVS